jgi:DNA-directed RNA polymerase subunit M/transcription elongation factor TFIIS
MATATADDCRHRVRQWMRGRLRLDDDAVAQLEKGIYNWTVEYANRYKIVKNWGNPRFKLTYASKARSVFSNLDADGYVGNQRLKDRMTVDREFPAQHVAFLRPDHAFPERWKAHLDLKLRRDEHVLEEKPAAMTDQYKCSRCKKRETIYQELQLRSADEPMSLFITCLNCGHRWRMG